MMQIKQDSSTYKEQKTINGSDAITTRYSYSWNTYADSLIFGGLKQTEDHEGTS